MVFVANLGRGRQVRRLRLGIAMFAVGLGLAVVLSRESATRAGIAALFFVFFIAHLLIAIGITGSDPILAERGLRDMDDGPEYIHLAAERADAVKSGRSVIVIAVVSAGLVTAILLLAAVV
ncbi:MAG: hypothetical protein IPK82_08705 [Polyangiaceae bacterium]|nr:hypothetical protein [Polyangiaceae bacterium]